MTPALAERRSAVSLATYTFGRSLFAGLYTLFGRLHVLHRERTAREGAWILASNHISHFDPSVIGVAARRPLDFMAMRELFSHPLFAWLLAQTGAIPVDRFRVDAMALRTGLRRLQAGRALAVFVEGGLRTGEASVLQGAPIRPGAPSLAVMSQAPILPAVVLGTDRFYERRRWLHPRGTPLWVGFGEALLPDPSLGRAEAIAELQTRLAEAIRSLRDELVSSFQLTDDDLPQTPQRRKGKEPAVPANDPTPNRDHFL